MPGVVLYWWHRCLYRVENTSIHTSLMFPSAFVWRPLLLSPLLSLLFSLVTVSVILDGIVASACRASASVARLCLLSLPACVLGAVRGCLAVLRHTGIQRHCGLRPVVLPALAICFALQLYELFSSFDYSLFFPFLSPLLLLLPRPLLLLSLFLPVSGSVSG